MRRQVLLVSTCLFHATRMVAPDCVQGSPFIVPRAEPGSYQATRARSTKSRTRLILGLNSRFPQRGGFADSGP